MRAPATGSLGAGEGAASVEAAGEVLAAVVGSVAWGGEELGSGVADLAGAGTDCQSCQKCRSMKGYGPRGQPQPCASFVAKLG